MNELLLIFSTIFFSYIMTGFLRRYSLKNDHFAIPNDRSSHNTETPHSGGLSIVVIFLIVISFNVSLPSDIVYALVGSGVLIAGIGFLDDLLHVSIKLRLLIHFIAAIWLVFWLGVIPEFHLLDLHIDLGLVGMLIIVFLLVWLLNLFNFMDGIDGIAASEAIFVSCGGAFFSWLSGFEDLSFISITLAASTMGFLFLNWSPAKIFMGDVGSCFLGLMLGAIAYTYIIKGGLLWEWLILLAIFLVDTSVTLLKRIVDGEKWYEAHCSHAYQHAARKWGHKKTTIAVIFINLLWLFPLATFSHFNPNLGVWISLLAFLPLIVVAFVLKAGIKKIVKN